MTILLIGHSFPSFEEAVQVMSDGAIFEGVTEFESGQFPSLHHRKEGWPSDKIKVAKPPLTRGRGGFPTENKEENHY